MTAIADDLCSTSQRSVSGELQVADYSKSETRQATTVAVGGGSDSPNNGSDYDIIRSSPVDLSAILEEGEDSASTSMRLSYHHDDTPSEVNSTSTPCAEDSAAGRRSSEPVPTYQNLAIGRLTAPTSIESPSELPLGSLTVESNDTTPSRPRSYRGGSVSTSSSDFALLHTNLPHQQSFSDDNLNITFDSQRCTLPCQPARASFAAGDDYVLTSGASSPTPLTSSSGSPRPKLFHVSSDAKLSSPSPRQRRAKNHYVTRSKSYSAAGGQPPTHARFLDQVITTDRPIDRLTDRMTARLTDQLKVD